MGLFQLTTGRASTYIDQYQAPEVLAVRLFVAMVVACLLTSCALRPHKADEPDLNAEVQVLKAQIEATRVSMLEASSLQSTDSERLSGQILHLSEIVDKLPDTVAKSCRPVRAETPVDCEQNSSIQKVLIQDDKMMVGELETVWVEPPGINLVARVDTGAQSSSLHAENLVEFERDGDKWVRFDIDMNVNGEDQLDDTTVTTLEREVVRYVRVFQQADPEGSRRPVVKVRLRLGMIEQTFELTLADRGHLDHPLLLGRNFLTDFALVDVARQFVQPTHTPDIPDALTQSDRKE